MPASKVVITGAAIISPLGLTRQETFAAVLAGKCGIKQLTVIECELPPGRDGGEAPPLAADYEAALPRESRYLRRAITDALADAHLQQVNNYDKSRCGIIVGTTLHGMRAAGAFLRDGDLNHLSRFLAANVNQMAAADLGIEGFSATTCSACSSSLGSIALAVTLLQSGDFDLIIAGGYDPVSEYAYAGFNSLRLVADGPLRPFAKGRVGMKLSEGYGIVVLERQDDAHQRGATPLAMIAGFGESADAHHLTQPHPQGEGAAAAMRQAIADAGLQVADINLLAAHATGTPDNDASEFAAMNSVFGPALPNIHAVAFKSHLGHTLGGAGAVELILSAMAMQQQIVPPCANVTREDIEFPSLNLSTGTAHHENIRATLNTSLGFGGANTCIVLVPPTAPDAPFISLPSASADREVVITGAGVVLPGAIGTEAFLQLLASAQPAIRTGLAALGEEQIIHLVNARRARRLSDYVKLMLAATSLAVEDAKITDVPAFAAACSCILGSTHGSTSYSETYYRQIVQEGMIAANPMLFAEGVPNSGSAHVSLMLGIKGGCQTIIGSRSAGLDALVLATHRIHSGQWDRAIVGAAEETSSLVQATYNNCGLGAAGLLNLPFERPGGFVSASGAVVFVLESRTSAMARGARPRAVIEQVATSIGSRATRGVLERLGRPACIMTSANCTRLDAAELAAIGQAYRQSAAPLISSMYGHMAETFSVTPLAGLAGVLLSGKLPRLWGKGELGALVASTGEVAPDDLGVICTDYTGQTTGVRVRHLAGARS